MESTILSCRICHSSDLVEVLNLGNQVITSRFPDYGDHSTPVTKIRLVMCMACRLVQLKDTAHSSELYEHMYGYRSGLNEMMRAHLKAYNEELTRIAELKSGDTVLDIGSNDATFLKFYDETFNRIGCDPTGSQFAECYDKDIKLIPTYFTKSNYLKAFECPAPRAITSISMFYDLPDPVQFAKDIYDILADDGVWSLEQSYVLTMLERNSIDTVCHEHLEYYGVKQIKEIMDRAGFKIIHISLNECNGGSFRIYVVKKIAIRPEATEQLLGFLEKEERFGIHNPTAYTEFDARCKKEVAALKDFINAVKADKKTVYIYGASTKGNCLLQYAGIDESVIPYAVERNPLKFGKMTSTGIPIISEEKMRHDKPDYLLVLPWHFKESIIERESAYLEDGGALLFPFPHFSFYTSKKRILITGIDGQIARYLIPKFSRDCFVIGTTRRMLESSRGIHKFACTSHKDIEKLVCLFKPNYISHLASISNTEDCECSPMNCIEQNGVLVSYICDLIHKQNLDCCLFHASSSEIYKGHINYSVQEDDSSHNPTTMYAFAKSLGHNFVNYYHKKYFLSVCNGVIFTTESRYRRPQFLLKKVALHAHAWSSNHSVLNLGALDSYRMINHADDVATAIELLLRSRAGGTYNICSGKSYRVDELVCMIYEMCGIELEKHGDDGYYYDRKTNLPVIFVGNAFRSQATNIRGMCTKLPALGWTPKYSLKDTLKDILEIET